MTARAIFWAACAACVLHAQTKNPQDLAVGKILVAPRDSVDPLFAESVVLLIRYSPSEAFGLMINKRSNVATNDALKELPAAAKHSEPVFVGGPVELDTVFALSRTADSGSTPIGDVHFIAAREALEKALRKPVHPETLRVYIGYCGWGPRQLESEVRRGGWYIFSGADLALDAAPEKLWQKLIDRADGHVAQFRP